MFYVSYLSHQKREALCSKVADVLLLVCQQCAVQAVWRDNVNVSHNLATPGLTVLTRYSNLYNFITIIIIIITLYKRYHI